MSALLEVDHVAVTIAGRRLFEPISIELEPRELVAITGPSGVGKSAFLRAVAGLIDPSEGGVRLEGQSPAGLGWPVFRRRVAYSVQKPQLFSGSVDYNLRRPFSYASSPALFDADKALRMIQDLGLREEVLKGSAQNLSVGEAQRVCLARILLTEPRVLLLDEPTSALDRESVSRAERVVRDFAERSGAAALIVTHDEAQAARWCDRAITIEGI